MKCYYLPALLMSSALVGCNGSSGESGSEGPEGSGSEGAEGNGGVSAIPFVSSGTSRGIFGSIPLAVNESFSGKLNDTEISMVFDPVAGAFLGRIKNEATTAICDVSVSVTLDGAQVVNQTFTGNPYVLAGLAQGGGATFTFPSSVTSFNEWIIETASNSCTSAPPPVSVGEGAEGSGSEGAEGTGGGGEAAEGGATSASVPLTDPYAGNIRNMDYAFAYDPLTQAFRGTVTNNTQSFICGARTEIHTGAGTATVELGPTIPEVLSPGETINVVMRAANGFALDSYMLHPEDDICPP